MWIFSGNQIRNDSIFTNGSNPDMLLFAILEKKMYAYSWECSLALEYPHHDGGIVWHSSNHGAFARGLGGDAGVSNFGIKLGVLHEARENRWVLQ